MKKEAKKAEIQVTKERKVTEKKNKVEKNTKKENRKSEGNIFNRIGRYFRGVAKEINRIKWTSGKDLVKYSIAAVVFVVFFGIYFYGIDWLVLLVRKLAK